MIDKSKLHFTGERLIPKLNSGYAFYHEHLIRYLFANQLTDKKSVLDAGCGTGYGSVLLRKLGNASRVYALDISNESINYAKENYKDRKIEYIVQNLEKKYSLKDKVDLAVSFEVIEHLKNQENYIKYIKLNLQKNGIFLCSTPNKYNYPRNNKYHINEIYPDEFKKLLKKYFKNISFFYQGYEFSQVIKADKKPIDILQNKYLKINQLTYSPVINKRNAQYIIAVCSDAIIPELQTNSMNSLILDNLDMRIGMISLAKQLNNTQYNDILLDKIIKSKFYKLWQSYCSLKKRFLKEE